jgi:hypothetical protein
MLHQKLLSCGYDRLVNNSPPVTQGCLLAQLELAK